MNHFPGYDANNPASETYLPISSIINRFRKIQDELRRDRACLPWWKVTHKAMLTGAIHLLEMEIEKLEETGGATVLARMGIGHKE